MTRTIDATASQTMGRPDPRALRTAARGAFIAAAFVVIVPVFVVLINVMAGTETVYDATSFRDPVTWSVTPYIGILTAISGSGAGACLLAVAARLPEILPDAWARAGRSGLTIAAMGYFVAAGGAAANYSTQITGTISQVQDDPAIRAMVGYADALATQGIGAASALGIGVVLVAIAFAGRRSGAVGAVAPWLAGVLTAAVLAAVGYGIGGPASAVLAVPALLLVGFSFALRARRARRS